MGYDLHITRAASWVDAASEPIPQADWERVVAADSSLRTSEDESFERRDADLGIVRVPAVRWVEGDDAVFWFDRGEVTAKNPDDSTIVKMLELAAALNARVFGDDDEEYVFAAGEPGYLQR